MWWLIAIVVVIILIYLFRRKSEGILIRMFETPAPSNNYYPMNRCYNGVPELDPKLSPSLWIPGSNTFPQQQTIFNFEEEIPAQRNPSPAGATYLRLIYSDCSKYHPLVAMFDNAIKEFSQRPEYSQFVFVKDKVPNGESYGEYSLPVVIKYYSDYNLAPCLPGKPYGKNPLIFRKTPEYGALVDFMLNASLLPL